MDIIAAQSVCHRGCAQAIGAEYRGRRAGSISFGCFNFFPSKNLGGFGDGGMVTAQDEAGARCTGCLRNHGAEPKYYHKVVGDNFPPRHRLRCCASKLTYLDGWTAGRQRNAAPSPRLFLLAQARRTWAAGRAAGTPPSATSSSSAPRHPAVMAELKARKIGPGYYPVPLHLQGASPVWATAGSHRRANGPRTRRWPCPIYPELTEDTSPWMQ